MKIVAVCLLALLLFSPLLPAQESKLDAATIAAMESVMESYGKGKRNDNFPYAELALVTEMALSLEGRGELGQDFRLGSGLHGVWIPSDWFFLGADIHYVYVGGPLPYLNAPGAFTQAECMVPLFHWQQKYVDEAGNFVLAEDSLLGPELGASFGFHGWTELRDFDYNGSWGNKRWFTHEGTATDLRLWAGLGLMVISPMRINTDMKGRFRASARFIYGNASAQDRITFESDGSTENSSFSTQGSMGGILRVETMGGFFGLACELGYYRGFHFAISMSPGWAF